MPCVAGITGMRKAWCLPRTGERQYSLVERTQAEDKFTSGVALGKLSLLNSSVTVCEMGNGFDIDFRVKGSEVKIKILALPLSGCMTLANYITSWSFSHPNKGNKPIIGVQWVLITAMWRRMQLSMMC